AILLDTSIPVGRWRIGIDPLLGLIPAIGDWIAAVLSLYIVYESARLGAPVHVLFRMAGNILIEALLGVVPVLGDLFDFAWRANIRNLALIEKFYAPGSRRLPEPRSPGQIGFIVAVIWIVVLAVVAGIGVLFFRVLD